MQDTRGQNTAKATGRQAVVSTYSTVRYRRSTKKSLPGQYQSIDEVLTYGMIPLSVENTTNPGDSEMARKKIMDHGVKLLCPECGDKAAVMNLDLSKYDMHMRVLL